MRDVAAVLVLVCVLAVLAVLVELAVRGLRGLLVVRVVRVVRVALAVLVELVELVVREETPSPAAATSKPLAQLSVSLQAPYGPPFFVDNVNVSERFYQLQQYAFDLVKTNHLTLESDTHLVLSLSSIILLIQNNNRLHPSMISSFGKVYKNIYKHSHALWNLTLEFPMDLLMHSSTIAKDLYKNKINRIRACTSLLNLADKTDDLIDKRLLVSISLLAQYLPMDATNTVISESALISKYILPALQPLFDSDDDHTCLEFTSTDLADPKKRHPEFSGCPDFIITIHPYQTDDGANVGFDEVKPESAARNHHLVNLDLFRLAVFGKDAIDQKCYPGTLSIYVVGR
ncbi:hypothetical protein [Absidia glauca]|uniref:Uncharacterized protein n=1 Tax=Absidia glauca TaxID=4829 RepID=A0A168LX17_ABSGL|nr:hypothetical protein [Absidia glauca]